MTSETGLGGRVLIADDHPLTREGLALAARSAAPGCAIDQAGSVREAEAILAGRSGYRLVLLDLMLPDSRGFSGLMRLQHLMAGTPIAIVSAKISPTLVEAAQLLGAAAYLTKCLPLDDLARRLRDILAGARLFPTLEASSPDQPNIRDRIAQLSGAQLRVLLALADGRLNKQIAIDLGVTEATVKAHLTAIFRKLGVDSRTQALLAVQPLLGEVGDAS